MRLAEEAEPYHWVADSRPQDPLDSRPDTQHNDNVIVITLQHRLRVQPHETSRRMAGMRTHEQMRGSKGGTTGAKKMTARMFYLF